MVGISGVLSGIFVVAANAWMNSPTGFDYTDGIYSNINPIKAMFNDAWFSQAMHMIFASFASTGFAVAGLHAFFLLKGKSIQFHSEELKIALLFAAIAMPITGDYAAKDVAKRQPAKLAAMEAHYHTQVNAPLIIGGIPNDDLEEVKYAIEIPGGLSFLAHGDFDSEVIGLDQFPKDERPPTKIVHFAFQIMVGLGSLMIGIGFFYFFMRWRKWDYLNNKFWLKIIALATPIGFIALEAGWTVTEVGRQPWIIYGIMKTKDALTPMPGIQYTFFFVGIVYIILSLTVVWLMSRQIKSIHEKYIEK